MIAALSTAVLLKMLVFTLSYCRTARHPTTQTGDLPPLPYE
jgi:hypothetical protein